MTNVSKNTQASKFTHELPKSMLVQQFPEHFDVLDFDSSIKNIITDTREQLSGIKKSKADKISESAEKLREAVINYLEEQECIKRIPMGNNWAADVKKIKKTNLPKALSEDHITKKNGVFYEYRSLFRKIGKEIKSRGGYQMLYFLLKDFKAIPMKNGIYDATMEPLPLFFIPNLQAPFDLKQYQEPKAIMSIADAGDINFPINKFQYSGLTLDQSRKSWIPYYIYHPEWGNGKRNKDGVLEVDWHDKDGNVIARKPISHAWIYDKYHGRTSNGNICSLKFGEKAVYNSNIYNVISNYCSDLTKAGVIKPDDFKILSSSKPTTLTTKKIDDRRGITTIDGQSYTFGTKYNGSTFTKITDGAWLIERIDGQNVLFYPMNPSEVEILHKKLKSEGKKNPGAFPIGKKNPDFDWKKHLIEIPNIDTELGIDKNEVSALSRLQLIKYIDSDKQKLNRLKKALQNPYVKEAKNAVVNAFIVCSYDTNMADIILDLVESHPTISPRVFKQFNEMLEIFKEQENLMRDQISQSENSTGLKVDKNKLLKITQKYGIRLIKQFAELAKKGDFDSIYKLVDDDTQKYREEILETAGIFSAIAKSGIPPEEMNKISQNISVDVIQAGGLVKSKERKDILNAENYSNPEIFNEKDYKMLVSNLQKTYQKIDPGWLEYLIDNIPKDLNNSEVKFVLLRNKKTNKLIGVCKIKEDHDEPGAYYFGTHYVEGGYQKDFNVGRYLQKIAESQIPEGAKIVATVSVANPAMERHIEVHNGVGTDIVFEKDNKHSSRELIQFAWNYDVEVETKNTEKYPKDKIISIAENRESAILPDNIDILKADTSIENNAQFLKITKNHFNKGYVLTRVIYERDSKGNVDLTKTYLVFEKPLTKEREAQYKTAA